MTLAEFLTARFEDDAAELVVPGWAPVDSPREGWGTRGDECLLCDRHMYNGTESSTAAAWEHHYDVTHRKTRVLAEVEARRRIVELHAGHGAEGCQTLRLLALPHADHPDYDESWRPEAAPVGSRRPEPQCRPGHEGR